MANAAIERPDGPLRGNAPHPGPQGELAEYWAFSVDEDSRVLFRWEGDEAFLVNLGSHDEVD